jgi:hypothetical protein
MADRYNIITGKIPTKSVKSIDDGIAEDIKEHFKIKKTTKRSTSMALRGPDGFEIFIPVRNIRFHQQGNAGNYEFHLEIPRSAGTALAADITRANPDAEIRPSPRLELRRRYGSLDETVDDEEIERMIPQSPSPLRGLRGGLPRVPEDPEPIENPDVTAAINIAEREMRRQSVIERMFSNSERDGSNNAVER